MRAVMSCFLLWLIIFSQAARGQNDVMLQGFYWDVPQRDVAARDGNWWDTLAAQAPALSAAGFTGVWIPSPCKGHVGIHDMGYGIYDHYDLGNYHQKDTTETRFGSRDELMNMVGAMHVNGIEVYADIVLNHLFATDEEAEVNPAVKQYVFDEANRLGSQFTPYPTNEIEWRIPNAAPGDYYIKIKGYALQHTNSHHERSYDLMVRWDNAAEDRSTHWESEPNDGNGNNTAFPGSAKHIWANIGTAGDIDEYKVTLAAGSDLTIRLEARKEEGGVLVWSSQTNGYYPFEIWHDGKNLADSKLQARTRTHYKYATHHGAGEPNYEWNYEHFHPVDKHDWLGGPGSSDEVISNTKMFGNDLNTFSPIVQSRLKNWGVWLNDTVGFDGYRLDFVRGYQDSFAADWINAIPKKAGRQPFIVGEYWGNAERIHNWVNSLAAQGADADAFDFPLKWKLNEMANGNQSWDMRWLNHEGLVRNNQGHSLPGTAVVTFVENHDTGKEHGKWVRKDWDMAYAYILFAEGRPCVFYSHLFGVAQKDQHDHSRTVTAPASLQQDLDRLIHARRTYLGGIMSVLSEAGNPWPANDAHHVFVARRQGNGTKSGGILVINNHDSNTKELWVDNAPGGSFVDWSNKTLVNAFDASQTTRVYADGRVKVSAPPRSYAIYVPQDEYVAP